MTEWEIRDTDVERFMSPALQLCHLKDVMVGLCPSVFRSREEAFFLVVVNG